MHVICDTTLTQHNPKPTQDLATLAEVKAKKLAVARAKEERAKEAERRKEEKLLADKRVLEEAKKILSKHQQNRAVCNKKLTCSHLVVLLRDMGLDKEAHSREGTKRLLQSDLRSLYWSHHVNVVVPPGSDSDSHHSDSDSQHSDSQHSDSDSNHSDHSDSDSDTSDDMCLADWRDRTRNRTNTRPSTRSCTRGSKVSGGAGSGEESEWDFDYEIGDRVEVHWPEEGGWFLGDITDIREGDREFEVHYLEDGLDYIHPHDMEVRTPQ